MGSPQAKSLHLGVLGHSVKGFRGCRCVHPLAGESVASPWTQRWILKRGAGAANPSSASPEEIRVALFLDFLISVSPSVDAR